MVDGLNGRKSRRRASIDPECLTQSYDSTVVLLVHVVSTSLSPTETGVALKWRAYAISNFPTICFCFHSDVAVPCLHTTLSPPCNKPNLPINLHRQQDIGVAVVDSQSIVPSSTTTASDQPQVSFPSAFQPPTADPARPPSRSPLRFETEPMIPSTYITHFHTSLQFSTKVCGNGAVSQC